MSAIFGFAYLDGRPIPPEVAARMRDRAAAWGPDGTARRQLGSAMLGHALLDRLPEDRFTAMPFVGDTRQMVFTAAGRLDNRDDLCDEFDLSHSERQRIADSTLMLRAYERWGEECPRRLFGDWSLAAWHSAERRLFLARDQSGNTGLFYWHRFPLVAFASDAEVLFSSPDIVKRIDEEHLARYLIVRPGELNRTFFDGVRQLVPGHTLSFDEGSAHSVCYWRPHDAPAVRFRADEEYVEAFLDLYRRSVRTRLRCVHGVASTLSSGLDSGSVTALAAEARAERGQRLTAITSVPLQPFRDSARQVMNEGPLSAEIAHRFSNINHILMDSRDCSPVQALRDSLGAFSQPLHGASNLYWVLDILREARAAGAGVLLTGQHGNCGVSWTGGSHRLYHLLSQPWTMALPWLREWRAHHGVSWATVVRRQLVPCLFWPLLVHRHRLVQPLTPRWAKHAAISPAFFRRLTREGRLERSPDMPLDKRISPRRERIVGLVHTSLLAGPCYHALGSAFGLDVRDPTGDTRLLEYCLGVPDEEHVFGGGDRMLMRRSMRSLLPASVRESTQRGLQASDLRARVLARAEEVEAGLTHLASSATVKDYLDVRGLTNAWRAVQSNSVRAEGLVRFKLLVGMQAGLFVRSTTGSCSEPASVGLDH